MCDRIRSGIRWHAILVTLGLLIQTSTTRAENTYPVLRNHGTALPGIVEPAKSSPVAPPFPGILARIHVKEGDAVRQGQILATLDDRVARATLATAEAAVNQTARLKIATVRLQLAERYLARLRETHDVVSGHALDEAAARVEELRAEREAVSEKLREAEARVQLHRTQVEMHQIRAPFDGFVSRLTGSEGEAVSPNAPILVISNVQKLHTDVHLPFELFGKLAPGTRLALHAGAPLNCKIDGRVLVVDPHLNAATRTFRCLVEIDNSDRRLPSGFAVIPQIDSLSNEPQDNSKTTGNDAMAKDAAIHRTPISTSHRPKLPFDISTTAVESNDAESMR